MTRSITEQSSQPERSTAQPRGGSPARICVAFEATRASLPSPSVLPLGDV